MKTQGSALRLQAGNRATLIRCTFYDNYLRPGDTDPEDAGPAIAAVSRPHKPNLNPAYAPAGLWLHSCDFRNNTPAMLGPVAVNASTVHSNSRAPAVVDFAARTVNEPSWLRPRTAGSAVAGAIWDSSDYPTEWDTWFQEAVQVRPPTQVRLPRLWPFPPALFAFRQPQLADVRRREAFPPSSSLSVVHARCVSRPRARERLCVRAVSLLTRQQCLWHALAGSLWL